MVAGMVLAAGLGTRMRPLTLHTPKPLLRVGGKPLLEWSLQLLEAAGMDPLVVNASYLGEQIEAYARSRAGGPFTVSHEETPLETGGGIAKALPLLGDAPVVVMNGDAFCLDGPELPMLERLLNAWGQAETDILLLLQPREEAIGYSGVGDFFCDEEGRIRRRREDEPEAPYVFTGVQMLDPAVFEGAPAGPFSMNMLYDGGQPRGEWLTRVRAVVHDGPWLHVGTPAELERAEAYLNAQGMA